MLSANAESWSPAKAKEVNNAIGRMNNQARINAGRAAEAAYEYEQRQAARARNALYAREEAAYAGRQRNARLAAQEYREEYESVPGIPNMGVNARRPPPTIKKRPAYKRWNWEANRWNFGRNTPTPRVTPRKGRGVKFANNGNAGAKPNLGANVKGNARKTRKSK